MGLKTKVFIKELIKLTILALIISVLIALYRYAAHFIIDLSNELFLSEDAYTKTFATLLGVFLIFLGYAVIRLEGSVQGGGLSQLKLMINNKQIKFRYYFAVPLMFVNSLISFFVGAPLGSESPSAFIGGATAYGVNDAVDKNNKDDAYLGMAIAFTVAFNAPIAGFLYGFEECVHSINIKNIFKMIYIMTIAYLVSLVIIPDPLFEFEILNNFDFNNIYAFIFVIAINFIIAATILYLVPKFKIFLDKHYTNPIVRYRYFILAFLSLIILLTYPILSGNGNNMIDYVLGNPVVWMVVIYLIVRMILFIFAANSMMTGGLVLPGLALGALSGYLAYYLANLTFGLTSDYLTLFIVISMVTLFACLNGAPFTAVALAISFTNYQNILVVLVLALICVAVCFILTKVCRLDDIVDSRYKLLKTSRKH